MAFIPDPNNISIDFGNYIIYVPKSATTLVQTVPSEIRELDLNWFRLQLKDIEDAKIKIEILIYGFVAAVCAYIVQKSTSE